MGEETFSGLIEPALSSIVDGERAFSAAHYDADAWAELAQSALVGGVLGALGGNIRSTGGTAHGEIELAGKGYIEKTAMPSFESRTEQVETDTTTQDTSVIEQKDTGQETGVDKSGEASIIPDEDDAKASARIPWERDIEKQSAISLIKGIKSLEAQIVRHNDKIAHPEKYVLHWHELPKEAQDGLIRHWQREIRNFETSIQTRKTELNGRGE